MFSRTTSSAVLGLDATCITVEVDISGTWPGFIVVGLGDAAVQEAKERIRSALRNAGVGIPANQKIIINLAPADTRKEGTGFDLPMAMGMFLALEDHENALLGTHLVGELALDGSLRAVPGILSIAIHAKQCGARALIIPYDNAREAALIPGVTIYAPKTLQEVLQHVRGEALMSPIPPSSAITHSPIESAFDFSLIKGQEFAKRALEIAAAGGHNALLSGSPGSGKTLLSRTLPTILPPMLEEESIEVTKIYSVAGCLSPDAPLITERAFRAPHHSASIAALVGGGKFPRPGEISLAHRGVLFLDEFLEFPRVVLESLRQPLEDGVITISRANGSLTYPARFMLVASQNPCPCGYAGDKEKECVCSSLQIMKYQKRLSGPLLDRIDIHLDVPRVPFEKLHTNTLMESSAAVRERVIAARAFSQKRFLSNQSSTIVNSDMVQKDIKQCCAIPDEATELLRRAMQQFHFSARTYFRILKVARTIADLAASENIVLPHIAEALQLRKKIGG